jgi:hypothetical protein
LYTGFTVVGHFRRLTSCPSRTRKSFELIFIFVLSTCRPYRSRYAILRRVNTGTFTTSKTTANAAAAASVPATTKAGRGIIARPPTASIAAITTSATDDRTSQRLGREPHRCRR